MKKTTEVNTKQQQSEQQIAEQADVSRAEMETVKYETETWYNRELVDSQFEGEETDSGQGKTAEKRHETGQESGSRYSHVELEERDVSVLCSFPITRARLSLTGYS